MCKINFFILVAAIFVMTLTSNVSRSQAPPRDPTAAEGVHSTQLHDRFRVERQIEQASSPIPGVVVTSPQAPPINLDEKSREKIFKLNQVLFAPMPTSVSRAELERITSKYISMDSVSIYDLYSMVVEIDSLFDKKNILARAGLPVQDVENGIVTVQIVEGKIRRTNIETKAPKGFVIQRDPIEWKSTYRLFGKRFVRNQFHFSGRNSFNVKELEEEILRFNRTFQSQLVAEIEPGEDLGSSALKVTRLLPKPVTGGYYVDNTGRETSGKIRNGMYLSLADVLGLNESYYVSYDETKGTTSLYMSGEMPVSCFGTFFSMSYYYGTPTTISGPFADLNINGTSTQYRPGFRQILVNTKKRRLDATLYYENYHSKTYFDTLLNYGEKLDSIAVGLDFSHRERKSAVFAGMSVVGGNAGILMDPFLEPDTYTRRNFCLMKFNLMKVWYPNEKTTFILRGNGNAALSNLSQSQVFQIGGMATVRGTPEGMMSAESGYLVSAEGRFTVWSGAKSKHHRMPKPCEPVLKSIERDLCKNSRIDLFTFFDHGGVFYREHPGAMRCADFLFSVGVGGNLHLGKHFSATCGYGEPIFTAESHQEEYRDKLKHGNFFFTARASF